MARQKTKPQETGRKKRTGSHAVVPKGYELVKVPKGKPDQPEQKDRNSDPISNGLRLLARHKWQLTPWVGFGLVVWAATTSPVAATITLAAIAGLAHLAATRGPEKIWGRTRLSVNERTIVRLWALVVAAWCYTVSTGTLSIDRLGLGVLAVLFALPSWSWWKSRRPDRPVKLSKRAKELVTTWPLKMGTMGPQALRGSKIEPGSIMELPGNGIKFRVRLFQTHGKAAASGEVQQRLEVVYELGVDTVLVETVRDDSGAVDVTMTPERHLEQAPAEWPGPVLHDNGDIDFAVTDSQEVIRVGLYNRSGIEHAAIVGATGGGKSNSVVTMTLPGVLARREVVFYCDGKRGLSSSFIAGACDWWAVTPEDWKAVVEAVTSVSHARMARRAAKGWSSWRGAKEKDPIVTLICDEASLIDGDLSDKHRKMVMELIRAGRALGIRIIQITQDPMGTDWIGGRVARDQMIGGGVQVGHRPGGSVSNYLSVGSAPSSAKIDLLELPGGPGKEGFVGIIRRSEVIPRARVLYADEERVLALLAGFTPRELAGQDLVAAGAEYRERVRGVDAAASMAAAALEDDEDDGEPDGPLRIPEPMILHGDDPVERALNAAAQANQLAAELRRSEVLDSLRRAEQGATGPELAEALNMNERTVRRHLDALRKGEQASYDPTSKRWSAVREAVSA